MRSTLRSSVSRLIISVLSLAGAIAVSELLRPYLGREGPVLFLLLAVIATAYGAGLAPAVAVTLISAGIVTRSFAAHSIHPSLLDELVPPGVFCAIGVGVSWFIVGRGKILEKLLRQNTQLANLLDREQQARNELKAIADQLSASDERFRIVAALTRDALWDWRPELNRLEWTDGLTRVFGYEPEKVSTDPRWWQNQLHPDDRDRVLRGLSSAMRSSATTWADEFRFRRADGEYAFVLNRAQIMRDGHQLPMRIIGSMLDLTDLKRAEASLRESQRFLQRLLRSVPSPVLMLDSRGHVVLFNRACEQLSGFKRRELLGRSLAEAVLAPEDAAEFERRLADPLSPLACEPQTLRWICRSGHSELIRWHFTVVRGPQGPMPYLLGAGAIVTDQPSFASSET